MNKLHREAALVSGDSYKPVDEPRVLRWTILTTGAELCDRLDQMIALDRRRVEALEKCVALNEEELRAYKESTQGEQRRKMESVPFSSVAPWLGDATVSVEPSGGDSTSEPPEQRT